MPSFLLLGGPISAFFAGLTAELHYCTFYSPFPSYKWKKTFCFPFQAWQCLPTVWFWLCKRVWWGHLQKTRLVFMHHGSRISLLLVSILCTISGGFLLGYWKSFFFSYCILFCFSNSTSSRLVSALTHTIYFHASFVSLFWVVWHLKMESRCRCLRRACNFPRGFPIGCLLDDFQSIINRLNVFSPRNIGLFRWLSQFSIIFFILFF